MKRTLCLMATALVVLTLASVLVGCGAALTNAAKLTQYDMGDDAIPSINSIVGEREVKSVQSSINNGVATKEYQYVSASVYDDLLSYVKKLMDDSWLVTQAIDLNVVPGSGELATKSVDNDHILLVSLTYDDVGYIIKITKRKGTLE